MPKPATSRARGEQAEYCARDYLVKQGLHLVDNNYKCKRGEIDLIMRDGQYLVFIEVRLRKRHHFGSGLESISRVKIQRIVRAAKAYLLEHQLFDKIDCRFDVVSLSSTQELDWIKNAFEVYS